MTSSRTGATDKPTLRAPKSDATREPPALAAARIAAEAALGKKAEEVMILDVRGLTSYADFFVLSTGTSDRQVKAIADAVQEEMKKAGHHCLGVEGYERGLWVLVDYGDVVVHVFYEQTRGLYDIEGLWAEAPRIFLE
ncbi:MAG TPA: ribosome silencing factor [Fredinandcohnia sp.]|nr:ribosome silencing factor [Fredinandcohnia sp.]